MRDYIDLAEIGTNLSVRADTYGPFALGGDSNGDYWPADYLSTPGVKVIFAKTDSGDETYVSFAIGDSDSE
jgi:hypothetical protein